jgi:hypothetical protein
VYSNRSLEERETFHKLSVKQQQGWLHKNIYLASVLMAISNE